MVIGQLGCHCVHTILRRADLCRYNLSHLLLFVFLLRVLAVSLNTVFDVFPSLAQFPGAIVVCFPAHIVLRVFSV